MQENFLQYFANIAMFLDRHAAIYNCKKILTRKNAKKYYFHFNVNQQFALIRWDQTTNGKKKFYFKMNRKKS